MATLYRKYRPIKFDQISGQEHVVNTLKKAVQAANVAHAYLFYGPRGTGKTSTARILAKRLNCTSSKTSEPCGKCDLCVAGINRQNIDLIEIDAASNRGIDDIRALQEGINLSPSMGKYKVYIIDEVHMLTREAFTALLKTLEEPVEHAIFILATTELHKVPDTIKSRCQVYRFRRASNTELKDRLSYLLKQEKREVDNSALDFVIGRSDGCYRDAESLLGQLLTIQDGKVNIDQLCDLLGLPPKDLVDDFLVALIRQESAPAVKVVNQAFAQGYDPESFVNESIIASRDGALSLIKNSEYAWKFVKEDNALELLPQIIRSLLQATQDLAFVPQPLIALHLVVLTLCNKKGQVAVKEDVVEKVAPKATNPVVSVQKKTAEPITITGDASEVKKVWPQLIDKMKQSNPVASTFLRAMEPVGINEKNQVSVRAQYALHRNFFEKAENKQKMAEILSELLDKKITISSFLEDEELSVQDQRDKKTKQEKELVDAVADVFGK